MVTCWERADLLALVGDVYCVFVTFPCGILGQMWYLIVSFPDHCRLSSFESAQMCGNTCENLLSRREGFSAPPPPRKKSSILFVKDDGGTIGKFDNFQPAVLYSYFTTHCKM